MPHYQYFQYIFSEQILIIYMYCYMTLIMKLGHINILEKSIKKQGRQIKKNTFYYIYITFMQVIQDKGQDKGLTSNSSCPKMATKTLGQILKIRIGRVNRNTGLFCIDLSLGKEKVICTIKVVEHNLFLSCADSSHWS